MVTAIVRPEQVGKTIATLRDIGQIPVSISPIQSTWLPARRMVVRGIEYSDDSGVRIELMVADHQAAEAAELICRCSGPGPQNTSAVVWQTPAQMFMGIGAVSTPEFV